MLEKQLSPIANYGGSSGTAKVHIEDFESLRNQGVDATLPGKYKKCLSGAGRKNQLLVEISWSEDSSSKIQRKLAKMAKKHYRKNADKARTLQRKEERKAKKYMAS